MGLFNRNKNADEVDLTDESQYTWMTVDEALACSRGEARVSDDMLGRMAGDLCEQVIYLRRQQEDTKYEFAQVTRYIADLQRLERMSEAERADVTDAARMIVSLDEERIHYQKGDRALTSSQYRIMEMYESEFPEKLAELDKHENFLSLVREDMHKLESEKGSISYASEKAASKQNFLNKFSYAVIFMVLAIFVILLVLADNTGKDFMVPFFITGVTALVYVFYYIYAIGQCKTELKRNEYMMNRATVLLNKVKIKFVNTTNVLEYSYEKYEVNSLNELRYVWESYQRAKEEERKYLKNTQLLTSYAERLGAALEKLGIEQPEAWIHQVEILLSRAEMADFKDAVTRRRNKLRAQIDYNLRQQDTTMNELEALKRKYAGREEVVNAVMEKNGITA